MATQAQINANRLNAQKSTGSRTEEGKRAVSQNKAKRPPSAENSKSEARNPKRAELT